MQFPSTRVLATVLSILALAAAFVVAPARTADAANAADFDAGFLISDADFFNGKALTAAEVDAFIKGTNKGCASGKTCITNYKEDITAKAKTSTCAAISAAPSQTAGQIIATVGKACGISPKAILVILQKEQSLVTATAPSSRAFAYAMGAGCADSTGCTTPYQGLYAQVYYGASLLKGYTLPSSSTYTRYAAGKTSSIKYHPTTSCGSKSVYVQNQATHALYVYTPYTPNAAALKNLNGTGDSCSSYGNRNFWRIYTDWWGPTGSAGVLAIDALYTKLGGSSSDLGARVDTIVTTTAAGSGLYQVYKKGIIAWNLKNGPHVLTGDIATSWTARIDDFGWPTQDTVATDAAGGGGYQNFDTALLTQASGAKVYTMWGATRTAYLKAGGPAGAWGWTTGYQAKDSNGVYTQTFTAGTAYRKGSKTGFVDASLVAEYTRRRAVTGYLGWPVGLATTSSLRGGGTLQSFDKGVLVSSSKGAYALFDTTLKKFNALGVSKVGWPVANRAYVGSTKWLRQDFENGSILIKGSTSAYMATEFVSAWVNSGFTTGSIGAPSGNPVRQSGNGGGVFQGFKKVALAKSTNGKVYRLSGQFRKAWRENGYGNGALGWPTSTAKKDTKLGLSVQSFQLGVVVANSSKYGVVGGNEWALAKSLGVGTGSLGWPTTAVKSSSAGGGGEYQKFGSGTITWQKARGAIYVPKAIWSAHAAHGGLSGSLGWPTSAAKTSSKGTVTQKFEGGTITWTKAKGAVITLASS